MGLLMRGFELLDYLSGVHTTARGRGEDVFSDIPIHLLELFVVLDEEVYSLDETL